MVVDFDFRNPDYDAVFNERVARLTRMRSTPGMVEGLKAYYKDNPAAFISDWGMTADPRNAEIGLPVVIPFILFPKQQEYVDWIIERWKAREDGLAEKSRDMGISWLSCAIAVWMWLFHDDVVIGFGSRKEEYVDKLGDPKSLFWKMRQFIGSLPIEFRPEGYNDRIHAPHMRILNPENGSAIVGEAGDNIGRGNRTSIYFKDESSHYEHDQAIDAALSQTSNCKIDVGTPNGNGNAFYRKRHGGKIKVFTFNWRDDPRKDDAWYAKQKETLDPVIVAQEVDIDYNASTTDSWINGDLISAAQMIGPANVQAIGKFNLGVDAAHYGDDESVIHIRRGRLNLPQVARRKLDGLQLAGVVAEECRKIKLAGGEIGTITIELDGPGVSCYDQLRNGEFANHVSGVHTGARQSDDINFNLRALLWRRARDYLNEPPVSMPVDPEIKTQLAAMRFSYKDGLLLIESKKIYKARIGRSPDKADAFVLSFGDPARGAVNNLPRRHGHAAASSAGY